MKNSLILQLYKKDQTVFTTKELSLLFPKTPYNRLTRKLSYYAKTGKISRPRRGIYVKNNFNPLELANKIYTPSYISLETVLKKAGIIFQEYDTIFLISYLTRKITCGGVKIYYRRADPKVLLNKEGVEIKLNYSIASPERAFLDAVYLYKDYHFDNLSPLDWDKVKQLTSLYPTKIIKKRVEEYFKIYQKENG
mgnify:CR=1 FL=1